jgi:photosystem II stability/assembly factor-like uncharacterized protein
MPTKTKSRSPKKRPIQHPNRQATAPRRRWPYVSAAAGLAALAAVLALTFLSKGGNGKAAEGLPDTPDYHSLLVDPSNPQRLVLGTHAGLYVSGDGGRHWRFDALAGNDAMNLARPGGDTIWLAGHNVFKKSLDGGTTWTDVRPAGLPGLDIHGFAVDPRNHETLYAAVAGQGLFRSGDGGRSFSLLSQDVGPAVMALAITPDRRILAGDMQQGLMASRDGKMWTRVLEAQLMGLAVNPSNAKLVLASGRGIIRSTDGGRTWKQTLELPDGAGPVAWAANTPNVAYVVGFDRTLLKTTDAGVSWQPVAGS